MGSMYWQFNDLWQAPTWSTIEYHQDAGKWKMAHYYVQNAYAPLLISPVINKTISTIDLYAVSDLSTRQQGRFKLNIYSYDSISPRLSQWIDFSVDPFANTVVQSFRLDEIEKSTGCQIESSQSCLLAIDDGSSFLFFNTKLAQVTNLRVANLKIESVEEINNGTFSIRLSTDQVALFVWLDITTTSFHGIFSKNGFHMFEPELLISFHTDCQQVDAHLLETYLTVQTLVNSYSFSR